ncbi:hypothetical protein HJG53_16305 [Sphingomonas sp. ID1715]|jgi:hypothetical protein|uniref:Uncharacterized protein n=1 Tax=Sphingobium cyanobacteriorum TaxID=3063954 RepID=A0ABT8ZS82_9SPHN|nr:MULTISPECIES: hypothetical protein [Sphingomonadaceae]MDO7837051.1 hypothetical protein [Sphingobium sp. HBC34]NNM78452.1 hypothetical protein [Sphingomonas sp. ID1715]HUD30573.1 hypothetical protein [Novosphingobium sp.]|tara:strand:+ start:1813 stop:2139 length:327 start_codon:yes stop_codon:yes gene_type:complete
MNPALANELAARAADGWHPVTLNEIKRQLRGLGYALDRSLDCRSTAQIMTGPRAGKTYPTLSTGIKEADTGRSAFHVEARRDARFRAMQNLRFEVGLYAVLGGAIMDL